MIGAALAPHHVSPAEAGDEQLRADLVRVWRDATEAGGAIGLVPPVSEDDVVRLLDPALARVREGVDDLVVLVGATGRTHAMGFLVANAGPLQAHWRTVLRVAVHPDAQRHGAGLQLMGALHEVASLLGVEHLWLTVRGGLGLEDFYARAGYRVVGRHPAAIRVSPGEDRDEVAMVRPIR